MSWAWPLPLLQPWETAGGHSLQRLSLRHSPSTPQTCTEGVMGMEPVPTPAGEAPPAGLDVGRPHPDALGRGSGMGLGVLQALPSLGLPF